MFMLEHAAILLAVLAGTFSWFHFRLAYKNGHLSRLNTWSPMPMLAGIGLFYVFVFGSLY